MRSSRGAAAARILVRLAYELDDLRGLRDSRISRLIIRFTASRLFPFKSGRRAKIASNSALAAAERSCVGRPQPYVQLVAKFGALQFAPRYRPRRGRPGAVN
jgi:hypothetical protein